MRELGFECAFDDKDIHGPVLISWLTLRYLVPLRDFIRGTGTLPAAVMEVIVLWLSRLVKANGFRYFTTAVFVQTN